MGQARAPIPERRVAVKATLNNPSGVAIDGAGNIYIADTGNNVIRKITVATGIIDTVAGDGTAGFKGDGGKATLAELSGPVGVTVDASGNIYIADTANQRIRKVNGSTGIISTVAGDGFQTAGGFGGYKGDNGPAIDAELSLPYAVAFDAAGNMYIPDSANNVVRKVDPAGNDHHVCRQRFAGILAATAPAIRRQPAPSRRPGRRSGGQPVHRRHPEQRHSQGERQDARHRRPLRGAALD